MSKKNKKFKKKPLINKNILDIKGKLELLIKRKLDLYKLLIGCEDQFNELTPKINSADEWLYSFPNIHNTDRSMLGDLRIRAKLRDSSLKTLEELESLESEIVHTKIELITAQISCLEEQRG